MGLLDGKIGLVVGIANERSYAWFIAQSLMQHGARGRPPLGPACGLWQQRALTVTSCRLGATQTAGGPQGGGGGGHSHGPVTV